MQLFGAFLAMSCYAWKGTYQKICAVSLFWLRIIFLLWVHKRLMIQGDPPCFVISEILWLRCRKFYVWIFFFLSFLTFIPWNSFHQILYCRVWLLIFVHMFWLLILGFDLLVFLFLSPPQPKFGVPVCIPHVYIGCFYFWCSLMEFYCSSKEWKLSFFILIVLTSLQCDC